MSPTRNKPARGRKPIACSTTRCDAAGWGAVTAKTMYYALRRHGRHWKHRQAVPVNDPRRADRGLAGRIERDPGLAAEKRSGFGSDRSAREAEPTRGPRGRVASRRQACRPDLPESLPPARRHLDPPAGRRTHGKPPNPSQRDGTLPSVFDATVIDFTRVEAAWVIICKKNYPVERRPMPLLAEAPPRKCLSVRRHPLSSSADVK